MSWIIFSCCSVDKLATRAENHKHLAAQHASFLLHSPSHIQLTAPEQHQVDSSEPNGRGQTMLRKAIFIPWPHPECDSTKARTATNSERQRGSWKCSEDEYQVFQDMLGFLLLLVQNVFQLIFKAHEKQTQDLPLFTLEVLIFWYKIVLFIT